MQHELQTHMDGQFQGMMSHIDDCFDHMQSTFDGQFSDMHDRFSVVDSQLDEVHSQFIDLCSHIQTIVHDPIMSRMNNMQQSFQDNMSALSSQFESLSTVTTFTHWMKGSNSFKMTSVSSPLSLTTLAPTITACICPPPGAQ
jgi:hypothetical protein